MLLFTASDVRAQETVLVKDSQGQCTIVVPAKEETVLREAAEDLAYHLEKMSGASIPIVSDPDDARGVPIYIGAKPDGINLPVDLADESRFWHDGYLIMADGEQVILAAPRTEGIQNAVYGLLEDHLGCHWFAPGEIGEHIPNSTTVKLNLAGGYQVAKPSRELRSPYPSSPRPLPGDLEDESEPGKVRDLGKWLRRNRHGGLRGYYGHNWYRIYTRELLEKEPDLAPFYGGRRHPEISAHRGQVCLSNPMAVDIAVEYYIRFFADNPQYDFYSFAANDGKGWCQCNNCKAMSSNDAGRVLIVANKVIERVALAHPGKRLAFLVYGPTFVAPKETIEVHDNLIGVVCSANIEGKPWMDQIKPKTDDHPDALSYRRNVERWMGILPTAWTYDYHGWFPGPYTMFHKQQAERDYQIERGFTGDGSEYVDRNMGTDVHMWLSMRMGWDQNLRVEGLLGQFYPAYFGAAAEDMRYIYERFENHMRSATPKSVHEVEVSNAIGLYPLDLLDDALARVARARSKVGSGQKISARLARDEQCLRSTRLFIEAYSASRAYYETGNPEDQNKAIAAADAYLGFHDRLQLTLPAAAQGLMEAFVVTRPGSFNLLDRLSWGDGKSWRAKTCSGFKPGDWGLNLAPNTEGEIIYEVQTRGNLKFKNAKCRVLHQGQIEIEISADDSESWQRIPADTSAPEWHDLGRHVVGRDQFLIRFKSQNNTTKEAMAIDQLQITGNVE